MSLQYIIDGYNIIKHPLFAPFNKKTKDAKFALLYFLKFNRFARSLKNKITVVFDGYPDAEALNQNDTGINVVFSKGESADERIKKIVEDSSNTSNIVVVSDDKEIKFIVKSLGARCFGIEEFIHPAAKPKACPKKDLLKPELTYSQIHQINQELKNIWLK